MQSLTASIPTDERLEWTFGWTRDDGQFTYMEKHGTRAAAVKAASEAAADAVVDALNEPAESHAEYANLYAAAFEGSWWCSQIRHVHPVEGGYTYWIAPHIKSGATS